MAKPWIVHEKPWKEGQLKEGDQQKRSVKDGTYHRVVIYIPKYIFKKVYPFVMLIQVAFLHLFCLQRIKYIVT